MRVLDVTEPCAAATFPSRLDFWRCSHDLTRPGGFLGMAGIQTATYSIIDPPLVGSTMGGIKTFPGFPMVPTGPTSKRHVFFSCQKTKNASSTTPLPEALHHIATCFFLHRALKKKEQLFSRNDTWWYLYIIRSCVPLFSFQGFHNFAFYDWSLLHRPPRILEAIDISPGMGPKSGRTSMSKKWAALG